MAENGLDISFEFYEDQKKGATQYNPKTGVEKKKN